MKKLISLLSLFILFSIDSSAQNDGDISNSKSLIASNVVNKFTKDRIIKTKGIATVQWTWIVEGYIEFNAINDAPILNFWYCPKINLSFPNGAKLSLLDDKDSVYVFTCLNGGYAAGFSFIGNFENLINKNIMRYRLEGGAQIYEGNINKKKRTAFSDLYISIKNEILKYYPEGVKLVNDNDIELLKRVL